MPKLVMRDALNNKAFYGISAVAFVAVMFSLLTRERAPARWKCLHVATVRERPRSK